MLVLDDAAADCTLLVRRIQVEGVGRVRFDPPAQKPNREIPCAVAVAEDVQRRFP